MSPDDHSERSFVVWRDKTQDVRLCLHRIVGISARRPKTVLVKWDVNYLLYSHNPRNRRIETSENLTLLFGISQYFFLKVFRILLELIIFFYSVQGLGGRLTGTVTDRRGEPSLPQVQHFSSSQCECVYIYSFKWPTWRPLTSPLTAQQRSRGDLLQVT